MTIAEQALNAAKAIESATVWVTQQTGPGFTTYTLTGKRPAVETKVASLMREYNPWGYGTRVEYNETGAIVTRANSCD